MCYPQARFVKNATLKAITVRMCWMQPATRASDSIVHGGTLNMLPKTTASWEMNTQLDDLANILFISFNSSFFSRVAAKASEDPSATEEKIQHNQLVTR